MEGGHVGVGDLSTRWQVLPAISRYVVPDGYFISPHSSPALASTCHLQHFCQTAHFGQVDATFTA